MRRKKKKKKTKTPTKDFDPENIQLYTQTGTLVTCSQTFSFLTPSDENVCEQATFDEAAPAFQAAEITQLFHNLDEYDKKALGFAPGWKKSKGWFLKKKFSGHIGTEPIARYKLNNIGVSKGKKKIHSNNKKINN